MSYTMKILAATDTNEEEITITVSTKYTNIYAQACESGANRDKAFRNALEGLRFAGIAQEAVFEGAAVADLVEGYVQLDDDDNKEAKAIFKAAIARQCRTLYGFGCKVKDGQLIGTKVGAGKKAKGKSALVVMMESFEVTCTEVQRAEMETIVAAAVKLYADTAGSTIKA